MKNEISQIKKEYDTPGNDLGRNIIKYITARGHFATRVSSAGRFVPGLNRWIRSTTVKGFSDCVACINGVFIAIEIKATKYEKQSEDQIRFERMVKKANGQYWLIHSFDEFFDLFNAFINTGEAGKI